MITSSNLPKRKARVGGSILMLAMLALATLACSGSGSVAADGGGAADAVSEGLSNLGDEVSGAVEGAGADSSSDDSSGLPGWAWALIAAFGVIAIISLIIGLQNRGSNNEQTPPPSNSTA